MTCGVANRLDKESVSIVTMRHEASSPNLSAAALQQQAGQQAQQLATLRQFSQDVLDICNLDMLLRQALAHVRALVPAAQCGAIYLTDAADEQLVLHASSGFRAPPACVLPITGAGSVLFSHHWYIANSTDELALLLALDVDAHRKLLDAFALAELPSGIAVIPLMAQAQLLGMVILMRMAGAGPFIGEMEAGLVGLANMMAAVVRATRRARVITAQASHFADPEAQQRALAAQAQTAQAAMLQTARMAAIGQMTAAITHEINNPLWAVQSALDLMKTFAPDDPRYTQLMQIARDELARVMGITARMRDFYRPHHHELAACDLHQLLEETLALAELQLRYTRINVVFIPAAEHPIVRADANLLRQVFLNLILNAIDAMPDGGTLTVRATIRETALLVEVQDTGDGIAAEIRPHLFEPFITSKPNGTGLGLSISAQIIAQHAGTIEMEDNPDRGCTFRVVLPYQPRN